MNKNLILLLLFLLFLAFTSVELTTALDNPPTVQINIESTEEGKIRIIANARDDTGLKYIYIYMYIPQKDIWPVLGGKLCKGAKECTYTLDIRIPQGTYKFRAVAIDTNKQYSPYVGKIAEITASGVEAEELIITNKCPDGTPYNQCSSTKPKYCKNGKLIDNCKLCGCPAGSECKEDGSCESKAPRLAKPVPILQFFRLKCKHEYVTKWHSGDCKPCKEGYKRTKCEKKGWWLWEKRRETCVKEYWTECKQNPTCQENEQIIGREWCGDEILLKKCVEEKRLEYCKKITGKAAKMAGYDIYASTYYDKDVCKLIGGRKQRSICEEKVMEMKGKDIKPSVITEVNAENIRNPQRPLYAKIDREKHGNIFSCPHGVSGYGSKRKTHLMPDLIDRSTPTYFESSALLVKFNIPSNEFSKVKLILHSFVMTNFGELSGLPEVEYEIFVVPEEMSAKELYAAKGKKIAKIKATTQGKLLGIDVTKEYLRHKREGKNSIAFFFRIVPKPLREDRFTNQFISFCIKDKRMIGIKLRGYKNE